MNPPPSETPQFEIARFLRRLQWAAAAVAVLALMWLLAPILTPFAVAALLGWLGDPLVDRLERARLSRPMAVTLVFGSMVLLLVLALVLLVPMIERQVVTLAESLPKLQAWFYGVAIPWVEGRTGIELGGWTDPQRLILLLREHWQEAGGMASTFFGYVSRSGFALIAWALNLVLVPFLTFYFLRDWDKLVARVALLVPRDHIETATRLARESSDVLGAFMRGQFLVMVAQGAFYAIFMTVVGLRLGLLIGMIAGLISFVPYLGATVGLLLGLVAAFLQPDGGLTLALLVVVVFTAGQLLESYVLTPRIVGDRIGLHPVAIIFAIMAGGQLFGFLGMLVALPVAAVANVLLRYANERYSESHLYAGDQQAILLDPYMDKDVVVGDNRRDRSSE